MRWFKKRSEKPVTYHEWSRPEPDLKDWQRNIIEAHPKIGKIVTNPRQNGKSTIAEFCDICGELAQGTRRCERHAGFVFKDVVRGDYETRA